MWEFEGGEYMSEFSFPVNLGGRRPMTQEMELAAEMSAGGMDAKSIGKKLGVSGETVKSWLKRDDVIAVRNNELNRYVSKMLPKAYKVLEKQLDDKNPWVAQNAAREIIRLHQLQQGISDSNVIVTFASMNVPGAPGGAGGIEKQDTVDTEFAEE